MTYGDEGKFPIGSNVYSNVDTVNMSDDPNKVVGANLDAIYQFSALGQLVGVVSGYAYDQGKLIIAYTRFMSPQVPLYSDAEELIDHNQLTGPDLMKNLLSNDMQTSRYLALAASGINSLNDQGIYRADFVDRFNEIGNSYNARQKDLSQQDFITNTERVFQEGWDDLKGYFQFGGIFGNAEIGCPPVQLGVVPLVLIVVAISGLVIGFLLSQHWNQQHGVSITDSQKALQLHTDITSVLPPEKQKELDQLLQLAHDQGAVQANNSASPLDNLLKYGPYLVVAAVAIPLIQPYLKKKS